MVTPIIWAASTAYAVGQIVGYETPFVNQVTVMECVVSGTSGSSLTPTAPKTTFTDGYVTWYVLTQTNGGPIALLDLPEVAGKVKDAKVSLVFERALQTPGNTTIDMYGNILTGNGQYSVQVTPSYGQ